MAAVERLLANIKLGNRPSGMWRHLTAGYLVPDFLRQRCGLIFQGSKYARTFHGCESDIQRTVHRDIFL